MQYRKSSTHPCCLRRWRPRAGAEVLPTTHVSRKLILPWSLPSSASPGSTLEMQNLGPCPDPLNSTEPHEKTPGDSRACCTPRSTGAGSWARRLWSGTCWFSRGPGGVHLVSLGLSFLMRRKLGSHCVGPPAMFTMDTRSWQTTEMEAGASPTGTARGHVIASH